MTSSRSARSPPRFAAGASPSRIRARASSIAASIFSARKARRSKMAKHLSLVERRRRRVRSSLKARSGGRPRLSIHRSGRHIYVQVIDDAAGRTIAAASTLDKDVRGKSGATVDAATDVGRRLAERAKAAGVSSVVFDRGGFFFHGRVKGVSRAPAEGGLGFLVSNRTPNPDSVAAGPPP